MFSCGLLFTASGDGDESKKILPLVTRLSLTVVWLTVLYVNSLWKQEYVMSNSESVQCNFFIFDHLTFIQFKICCCVQNFIKIGWFLPRSAMHKRGLCRHTVSVTFVDHLKTNKHIVEIFSASGSHTILIFLYQMGWLYSDGNPPNGGVECRLGSQKSRFWAYIWL